MWRTLLAITCLIISTSALAHGATSKGVVVLIPGTSNSLAPGYFRLSPVEGVIEANPYFSIDVVSAIEAQGYVTHIVQGLHPFGQFEDNGERALSDIVNWYSAYSPHANVPITILAHSAGGFQALYVASHRVDLPIRRILLVSTPLSGVELADEVRFAPWIGDRLADYANATSGFFDLRGMPELTAAETARFLRTVRIPAGVRVYATGGSQEPPPNILHSFDAEYLPPIFEFTQHLIGTRSDGLVSLNSAYGVGSVGIHDLEGKRVSITNLNSLQMPLNHAEQIFDYRLFQYTGTRHAEFIRDQQRKFYSSVVSVTE